MESLQKCGCPDLDSLSEEVLGQLAILDNSQQLLLPIFLGLLLQYKAIDIQRIELLANSLEPGTCCTEGCLDPKSMQLGASLIILSSLLGFQNQAQDINAQAVAAGACPDDTDIQLGMIVILVALIRFVRLLDVDEEPATQANIIQSEEIADIEVI